MHRSIAQVFENNMGNRLTPELTAGMIRSLVDILAAGVQKTVESEGVGSAVQVMERHQYILQGDDRELV